MMNSSQTIQQCRNVVAPIIIALAVTGCTQESNQNAQSTPRPGQSKKASPRPATQTPRGPRRPTGALTETRPDPGQSSPQPRSILELPTDPSEPAIGWVETQTGRQPWNCLSVQDTEKLNAWNAKRAELGFLKKGDVMVKWMDIRDYQVPDEDPNVYAPPSFSGKPVIGRANQKLTDGRLAVTVTAAKKRPYISFHGRQPKVPYQYQVEYSVENRGNAAVEADHFVSFFFEPSGRLAVGFKTRNLKKDGNNYSDTDEPFVYEPGVSTDSNMTSRGECEKLNNVCLQIVYEDGTESMFVVYIPGSMVVDATVDTQ